MSTKKTQTPTSEPSQKQPAYVTELLEKGTVVLKAKNREKLAELVNIIPANCKYGAGAIGKNNESGVFTLRLDLVNN